MADAISRAVVEIVADFDELKRELDSELKDAFKELQRIARKSFQAMEGDASDAAMDIRKSFNKAFHSIEDSTDFKKVKEAFREVEFAATRAFEEASDEGKEMLREVLVDIRKLRQEMLELKFPQEMFRQFREESRRATRGIQDDFEDATTAIRQAFGVQLVRAAESGFNAIEQESFQTSKFMQRAMAQSIESIDKDFQKLAGNKIFEGLEDDVDGVRQALQGRLKGALEETQTELTRIGNIDSTSKQEAAFRDLAFVVENSLTEALEDARRQLQLLSGEESGIAGLTQEFRQLAAAEEAAHREADRLAAAQMRLNRQNANSGKLNRGLVRDFTTMRFLLTDIGFLVGSIGGGIALAKLGEFGVKGAAELQTVRTALTSFVVDSEGAAGAVEKVSVAIEGLREDAARTPFSFASLAEGTRRLTAFAESTGRAGENFSETFATAQEDILDLSGLLSVLGQGDAALVPLIKAIGDVGARGRITGEEVRQFANALPGFNVLGEIADQLGMTSEEFQKMNADGLIPAKVSVEALITAAKQFPGAARALDAQARTLTGRFETLKDELTFALADGFEPLSGFLGAIIPEAIDKLSGPLTKFGNAISELARTVMPLLIEISGELVDSFSDFLASEEAAELVTALGDALLLLVEVMAELLPNLVEVVLLFTPLIDMLGGLLQAFSVLPEPIQTIVVGLIALKLAMSGIAREGGGLNKAFTGLKSAFESFNKGLKFVGLGPIPGVLASIGVGAILAANELAGFFESSEKAAGQLRQELEAIENTTILSGGNQMDAVDAQLQEVSNKFNAIKDDVFGIGNAFSRGFGMAIPGLTTDAEQAAISMQGLKEESERLVFEMQVGDLALESFGNAISAIAPELNLTEAQLEEFATKLGVDLTKGGGAAVAALDGTGRSLSGVIDALQQFEITGFTASMGNGATSAQQLRQEIEGVTTALRAQADEQRAALDPAFALIKGNADLAKAREDLTNAETKADSLSAAEDFARATAVIKEASVDLAEIGGTEGAISGLANLFVGVEGSAEPLKILSDEINAQKPIIEASIRGLADAAGIPIQDHMVTAFTEGTDAAILEMEGFDSDLRSKLTDTQTTALLNAIKIGTNISDGIRQGLLSGGDEALAAAERLAQDMATRIRNALRIQSPSRVMMEIGGYVSEGLAKGISRDSGMVMASVGSLAANIAGSKFPAPQMGELTLPTAAAGLAPTHGSTSSSTVSNTRVVEAPITVNGAGVNPAAIGAAVSASIAAKMGV